MMPPPEAHEERWSDWLHARLFDRRVVTVTGPLDDTLAARTATELMTLDAIGDDAVRLLLDSGSGTLDAALMLMDVIDLLGVPVHATCVGRAEGPSVGVLAVAARRFAAPHARFRLAEPDDAFEGRTNDLVTWARHREQKLRQFCERVADAARRAPEEVAAAMREGRYLDAAEALRSGLIDEIARPNAASVHRLDGPHLGFRPPRSRRT